MKIPLQITFHGIPHSDFVETKIREKASNLEKFYAHIINCRVAVKAEHHNHYQDNRYHIRIDITMPRKELVVSREYHDKKADEDVYVALCDDAFHEAARQLEDHGFIAAEDGYDIYFHRNSVINSGFDALAIGGKIRYIEKEDDPSALKPA